MNTYNYLGIQIHRKNPDFITDFSKTLLEGHYTRENETIPQAFARAATSYCFGDYELAQRIYDYVYNGWFMFASPVLSNATKGYWIYDADKEGIDKYWYKHYFRPEEKANGLPISCFAFNVPDTIQGQIEAIQELAALSVAGGGTGAHNSIRGTSKKAPGPIPYEKMIDSAIGYFKQPGRRGAVAYYSDVDHPDAIEHIKFRSPGGDSKRRSDNRQQFHTGVNLTDEFIQAVLEDKEYNLKCPHSGKVFETHRARHVWETILETRALTGEPFLLKIDLANRKLPPTQQAMGLKVRGSNLCSEIVLPTDEQRTFVCCLSSLNLENFEEWKDTPIVEDLIRFLDNVLESFILNAPTALSKAKFSAERERALGLGAFGWHSLLQSKNIPFEGGGFGSAIQLTHQVFGLIKARSDASSKQLAVERGEAPDMIGTGFRNSRRTALAPNANSADIAGSSASMEPVYRNVYVKETRAGLVTIKNRYLEARLEELGMNTKAVWSDILANDGSVQHLKELTDHDKLVFKTGIEIDQHWVIEGAEQRGPYICQAQSLNVYFRNGASKAYVNSVHLKFLRADNVMTMYYYRTEREAKVDTAKEIERKALVDWKSDECVACQG